MFSYEQILDEDEHSDVPADHSVDPSADVEEDSFQSRLARAIGQLDEREQLIFALYYDEELNLKEIGAVIGVSESRVSQLMSQATLRLRARLSDWID